MRTLAKHLTTWFGHDVAIDGHFLDPEAVIDELHAAGFQLSARLLREPDSAVEYPSRRSYLLARASDRQASAPAG